MKHTQSRSSEFSDFPARLAYFSAETGGTDLPKNTPTAEVRTEAVPAPVNFEEKTMEENEMRAKHENEENQERSEQLPIIEEKFETSDSPANQKESQKEQVDAYYEDATDSLRSPMRDVVKAAIEGLTDREKSSLIKYESVTKAQIYQSMGESQFTLSPSQFGKCLGDTLRFSVFIDKDKVETLRKNLDPDFVELVDSIGTKINDAMGDEIGDAQAALGKMKDAATSWAKNEANQKDANEIRAEVAGTLQMVEQFLNDPGAKKFIKGMREKNSSKDASALTAETKVEGSVDNAKEKGIEKQTRTLQTKMRGVDADIKVQGTATLTDKNQSFGVSLENMDQNVKDVTLKEANRQFEKDEMKIEKDQLMLNGTEAIEFMNFLRRMNMTTWSDLDKEKEEQK